MQYSKLKIDLEKKFRLPVFDEAGSSSKPLVKKKESKFIRPLGSTDYLKGFIKSPPIQSSLPELKKTNIGGKESSFLAKVENARKALVKKRTAEKEALKADVAKRKKAEESKKKLDLVEGVFIGDIASPESVVSEVFKSFGAYFKVWQRKALLELTIFSGKNIPSSIYQDVPSVFSFGEKALRYRKGFLFLVEQCEKKLGQRVLSFEERAKLVGSALKCSIYTQIALNRIWYIYQSRR